MDKKKETNELSQQEIREIIEMIEDESYNDDYETTWDGRVTYISVNEDFEGCSAYYGYDEDGPRHSIASAYEIHKLEVGDYVIGFTNYGDGYITGLKILKNNECFLPNGNMKDELISAIQTIVEDEVYLPDDGDEQFNKDWTAEEIVEEIEDQLESDEYIKVDGTIYPADDWEYVVESLFDGEEPDEDSYTKMDRHEVAQELADNIDLGGY